MNVVKTTVLLVLLTAFLVFLGGLIGGQQGAMAAFILSLAINLVSYWFSDKIVLASYRAKPLSESDAPQVYRVVREIATRVHMPMPKLYWVATKTPNAFATGRSPNHAAVVVTSGILELVNEEELKGVLAHELSHVRNRDILTSSIAAALAGAIMMLARSAQWAAMFGGRSRDSEERGNPFQVVILLLVAILAPLAAMLIQLAISRSREYSADETGAHLAGSPQGLASALEKLDAASRAYPLPNANPATAHLFIVNPLSAGAIAGLFSTHPPTKERVRRLRDMRL